MQCIVYGWTVIYSISHGQWKASGLGNNNNNNNNNNNTTTTIQQQQQQQQYNNNNNLHLQLRALLFLVESWKQVPVTSATANMHHCLNAVLLITEL